MKVKLYVQAVKWNHDSEFKIQAYTYRNKTSGYAIYVDICERIIDVDAPEIDPAFLINSQVEQLEAAIEKEQKESLARVVAMQEKKASLLCIENGSDK